MDIIDNLEEKENKGTACLLFRESATKVAVDKLVKS